MSTIEERVAALESALASMTAAEKRIVELPAASSVANDDFVALDGVANGSRRFAASNLGGKAEVMTEAEWDDLPDSKLTDGKVYALSGVSPSTQDNPLWQKLGFASLDTQADDCSDAINELNTGLTTLNSNLSQYTNVTLASSIFNSKLTVEDAKARRYNNIVEVYIKASVNTAISAWETLLTLPQGIRPFDTNNAYYITVSGSIHMANINSEGVVNTSKAMSTSDYVRFRAIYFRAV